MFVMGDWKAGDASDDVIVNGQNHLTVDVYECYLKSGKNMQLKSLKVMFVTEVTNSCLDGLREEARSIANMPLMRVLLFNTG